MYKSKLQELCQREKLGLPKYTCVKDGEDHCPLFKAAVVVGDASFNSATACKSSKEAHNDAAKVAFLHLTSVASNEKSKSVEKTDIEKKVQSSIVSEEKVTKNDSQDGFKKKLQMYACQKCLGLPVYHVGREGVGFRGRVSINNVCFQSEELYETAEEAETKAAQTALLSLLTHASHQNYAPSYMILLRELAENEGFFLPEYTTIRGDDPDSQTFFSIVEVEGQVFQGAGAKSEELAELNAAKTAYTVLMNRKLFGSGDDDAHELASRLATVAISEGQENQKTETSSYLLGKRFRVFTSIPDTALPEGTVILPISENRWTVVSLEFPAENGI